MITSNWKKLLSQLALSRFIINLDKEILGCLVSYWVLIYSHDPRPRSSGLCLIEKVNCRFAMKRLKLRRTAIFNASSAAEHGRARRVLRTSLSELFEISDRDFNVQ